MNCGSILEFCQSNGIRIAAVDGKLKLLDPNNRLTPAVTDAIKSNREELIRIMTRGHRLTRSDFSCATLSGGEFEQVKSTYRNISKLYIATPMQAGLLFHGLLDGTGSSYTTQTYCDLVGHLDVAAFHRAWQFVVDRHDILRTCFVGLDTEQVHQLVLSRATLPVVELDWRDLPSAEQQQRLLEDRRADKAQGFDFGAAPLMRIKIVRLADDRYHFHWSHHHVLLDGWCTPIIFREVLTCYRAYTANAQPAFAPVVPYEHYIAWLFRQDQQKAIDFWRAHLLGLDAPTILRIAGRDHGEARHAGQAHPHDDECRAAGRVVLPVASLQQPARRCLRRYRLRASCAFARRGADAGVVHQHGTRPRACRCDAIARRTAP
jgi:hypothetical protein